MSAAMLAYKGEKPTPPGEIEQQEEKLNEQRRQAMIQVKDARERFIDSIVNRPDGLIKYIRILTPEEVEQHAYKFKETITGEELVVEYHLFHMLFYDVPIVQRWRLNLRENKIIGDTHIR